MSAKKVSAKSRWRSYLPGSGLDSQSVECTICCVAYREYAVRRDASDRRCPDHFLREDIPLPFEVLGYNWDREFRKWRKA